MKAKNLVKLQNTSEEKNLKLLESIKLAMESGEEPFTINTGEELQLAIRIIHRRRIKILVF